MFWGKSHQYGVIIYKAADCNRYNYNFHIYTEKQYATTDLGYSETVNMQQLNDLLECYRTTVADSCCFTSTTIEGKEMR